MTSIAVATPRDADALHAMIVQHAAFEGDEARLTKDTLVDLLQNERRPGEILVARDGAHAVGYASLTMDFSTWHGCRWGHLDCLFVRDGRRSKGAGRLLLEAARDTAVRAEAHWLEWQTPSWNERAIIFYQREGATIEAKTRFRLAL